MHTPEETEVTRLQRGYLPVLRFGLRQPFITLGIALLVFVATLGGATLLKTDFLGSVTDQTTLAIHQKLPPGTKLSTTSAAAEQVETILKADPQVKSYLVTIGGSLVPGAMPSTNTAEFTVLLVDGAKADAVRPQLEQQMAELGESAGEVTVTATNNQSSTNDLTVTVSSENTASLQAGAKRVEQELEPIPGLTNIRSNLEEQRKVLKVILDKKKAASLGFTGGRRPSDFKRLTRYPGRLRHAFGRTAGHLRSESGCRRTDSVRYRESRASRKPAAATECPEEGV